MLYNTLKRAACALLAGLMIFALAAPVFATETEYIETEYAEPEEPEEAETEEAKPLPFRPTANLNLRAAPCTTAERLALVPRSRTVLVHERRADGWYAVQFDGILGYMSAEFLVPADQWQEYLDSVRVYSIEWAEARTIIRRGVPMQITDVRTGITYRVSAMSLGNHADVETVTAEDTAAMLRAFGGRWTWTPRPVWVDIGGRRFAASINGMPHAGATINGNNMRGHVCLHFVGSRTHNGSRRHERDHQNAVQEAFRAGQL